MALLDLLGRRWALRVLWELRSGEAVTFRELQERCGGMSSSVLNDRLRELRESGIVSGGGRGAVSAGPGPDAGAGLRLGRARGAGASPRTGREDAGGGYRLTEQGAELLRVLEPVSAWAARWRPGGDS